jgi:hypothetical protein
LECDVDVRRVWGGHRVLGTDTFRTLCDHRVVGRLELDWQALTLAAGRHLTVIVFTAPADPQADSLRMPGSWSARGLAA